MIGLIDYDLQTSTSLKLVPPNIEIMKLAAYYRQEENHFCRLMSLEETELSAYDMIYIFSEADNYPQLPDPFKRADNVVLGGTAFTNGQYIPFNNEIIDFTIPRTYIYKEFLKEKYTTGVKTKTLEHILDDSYYRMYAGDKLLPIPPVLPRQRMYIYDKNIFVGDWLEIFNQIADRNPSSIKPIHPVICRTVTDYFNFRNCRKTAKDIDIVLDFNIPLKDTPYLMKHYKMKFLADIKPSSDVFITLGGSFDTERQYIKDYIYKMNLLFIFWSQKIPLKIKYIQPKIGYTDPLSHLSQLTTTWAYGDTKAEKSIKDRIPKNKRVTEIRPERIEKDKVIALYPTAKTLFDQTQQTIEKGGFWRYDT